MLYIYAISSVVLVSLVSLIGLLTFSLKTKSLKTMLIYLVSFSAGALFGDVFFHLFPEHVEEMGFSMQTSVYILLGIIFLFIVEKVIQWRHCHHAPGEDGHAHAFAKINLVGDGIHNFIDGLIIGIAYLVSIPVGVATTLAVFLHELPQEIGDYGILLHGGFTKKKALLFNFLSGLVALAGTLIALFLGSRVSSLESFLVPFAIGTFLYIAGSDLIPELHRETRVGKSILQLIAFVAGILVMASLLFLE
ncbi:MAG: ZIP family metal transporter [Candidatus Magasanikbacteria bacterium]|jgi:zinc and cadmium transporter|nr:ZIP family metal transporter [Candidatus Magasanikbacteria bacterium]MBT4221359.1 ZIP family metal transporter [Candidatus Magasanikbacteria bacterium]MBT4350793.1 ZIP family metal transporter [Candidatus Magasanikbacteria bacterium]MBT4541531.1 ZIP family metal transporter [Candidatus Magasanikbacteria bacterium]MBT6253483.1 ZIP family metal transporter [Candidatus Magasanikbacteria bacterium]